MRLRRKLKPGKPPCKDCSQTWKKVWCGFTMPDEGNWCTEANDYFKFRRKVKRDKRRDDD